MKRSGIYSALTLTGLLAAPAAVAAPADPDVTAISVLSTPGSALVVIDVNGAVNVSDFTLENPARLVVDVEGASLRAPGTYYDGENRGGIVDIRYSQFRSDVVRIVLELDQLRNYELEYRDNAIRVALTTDRQFEAWSSGQLARVAEPAFNPATAERAAPAVIQQSQQPRITVSYDSTSIHDVVATFAAFSGRSIVIGQGIDLVVRGEIVDQPWDVALNELLEANGLRAVEQESGIIRIQAPGAELALDGLGRTNARPTVDNDLLILSSL